MDDTIALVRRFLDALDQADGVAAAALLHEDVVIDFGSGNRQIGQDAFRHQAARRAARGERRQDVVIMASSDGSRAAAEFTLKGRDGAGEAYSVNAAMVLAVADGRIERLTLWGFPPEH